MAEEKAPLSLAERVARLEGALGWVRLHVPLTETMFRVALALLVVGVFLALKGLGAPNHYYQIVFAILTVVLAYHQGWFAIPQKAYHWTLAVLNTVVLTLIYKILIGSGTAQPLAWLKLPNISKVKKEDSGLLDVVPDWSLTWEPTTASEHIVDLTIVQTFLLLLTLLGAVFEFQPFASLTAFLLIVVSLPALVSFNWSWVFPALVVVAVALYVQSASANMEEVDSS